MQLSITDIQYTGYMGHIVSRKCDFLIFIRDFIDTGILKYSPDTMMYVHNIHVLILNYTHEYIQTQLYNDERDI